MELVIVIPVKPCRVVSPVIVKAPVKLIDPWVSILVPKETAPVPFCVKLPLKLTLPEEIVRRPVLVIVIFPADIRFPVSIDPVLAIAILPKGTKSVPKFFILTVPLDAIKPRSKGSAPETRS